MSNPYDDIIDLPHHTSTSRPRMPLINRAAQFSPFAALTGHSAAIKETARLTENRRHLAEDSQVHLSRKFDMLAEKEAERPEVSITYFQPDDTKEGGHYETITGIVKKVDDYEHTILLIDGKSILLNEIIEIESDVFKGDPKV